MCASFFFQEKSDTGPMVLVVDDNTLNRRLASFMLANLHVPHQVCVSGEDALKQLSRSEFRLVLMDIEMPGMDGYTCAAKIRNDLRSGVPIIAMTAHNRDDDKERMAGAGMQGHLLKPLNEEKLSQILAQYLQQPNN